ncbi:MAG: 23S rRNA pseudouridine1911/1915/1917 synthase [Gammaproteobacteria bacterium]|jgi:23S rRNA pseudouridine1911/1915/1917 synthase
MSDRFRANKPEGLMACLSANLNGWSRSRIKQRLKAGCVTVNGISVTRHDHALVIGDNVEVIAAAKAPINNTPLLEILYEDRNLIAINKPAGLLSVASADENALHALGILREQMSRQSLAIKLWPVHRIDRDTSGVMLFATSKAMREGVMANWDEAEKSYLAIVEGHPEPEQGTIDQPLRLDDVLYQMHVGEHPDARPAITHYQTEHSDNKRTLLQVQIDTGRQHQIRAHLAWLGYPVVGDRRYGTDGNRMGLHALRLSIIKPDSTKRLTFETPAPADFLALIK